MINLASWSRFLSRQAKASPLSYVHGMRHPVSSGPSCEPHFHAEFEIVYHPKGSGVTVLDQHHELIFGEGSVVINAPNAIHDQVMEKEGEDFCVQIAVPEKGEVPKIGLYIPRVESRSVREDLCLLSLGYPKTGEIEQAILNLRATALLLELIRLACTQPHQAGANPAEQHVLKAEQYIRENFSTIESLTDVADHVGVSHVYLRHIFKQFRAKPIVRHLNEVRVERAEMLLRHSRLPIKQVATMCGYKDEYYFSAVFRQYTGNSPAKYRRTGRA